MALGDYGPLTSEDGSAMFEIEALRLGKGHLVARFRGIEDRAAAERLANVRLFVPRERLPPLAADEFYHADLIGLCAVKADGSEIGTVVAVHDFGAGHIHELAARGSARTLVVPFPHALVPNGDSARGRIVVATPDEAPQNRGTE